MSDLFSALTPGHGYFIAGTDTGVGKTHVVCMLVDVLKRQGLKVAVMKPVAAGVEPDGMNEDVRKLMQTSNVPASLNDVCPYMFDPPIAPHIAAGLSGQSIDLAVIKKSYLHLLHASDVVIVEGAGGLLVPIDQTRDMSEIPHALDLPVILVVGMRLGCLNHALLSCEAIRARGLKLAGWVANLIDPNMYCLEENIRTLKSRIGAPCLAIAEHSVAGTLGLTCFKQD